MQTRHERGPAYDRLKALIAEAKTATLKVGFPTAAKYEDGTPVAYVAAIQEMGSPEQGIPPRPFMRPTAVANAKEWGSLFARGARAAINERLTLTQSLDQIGLAISGDIAKAISQLTSPALKAATIRARQARYASGKDRVGNLTKPLVDTGLMFNTVSHEVSNDSGK